EMARILADIPMRKTIIFMLFSAEEVGLVGSYYAASDFFHDGTPLEVMFNFDMVGYNGNGLWLFEVGSGENSAYAELQAASCSRVNPDLVALSGTSSPGSSDHMSFWNFGYNICNNIEEDFNYGGWHTDLDLTSRMDFDYLYQVARMTVATLGIVGNSASPISIEQIIDQGDGQALEIHLTSCAPEYTYRLYHGPSSGFYTDSIDIPSGTCTWIVDGLIDGQERFFYVLSQIEGGYPAVYSTETSATPYLIPRPPTAAEAGPELNSVLLEWGDNAEADFSHYRLYRAIEGLPHSLFKDNIVSSSYTDTEVLGQTEYSYKITAVDFDGYESDYSSEVSAYAATFDGGILLVDETRQGGGMPDQPTQEARYASYFAPTPYNLVQIETVGLPVTRNTAGQYSSLFWIDDDFSPKLASESEDSLFWYAGYTGNLFFAGFRTIEFWTGSPLSNGDFLYDQCRIASHSVHAEYDFAGATGVGGWPDIEVDTTELLGFLPFIPTLGLATGGQPIYLYDSKTDDPASEGNVCGVYYDGPNGKRVVLAFPLMYITDESAIALMSYAKNLFGESVVLGEHGDIDNNGQIDIGDLVYLVDYMFLGGPPPPVMNSADVDASCQIDIADLIYVVVYFFDGGPLPLPGCVE
ncbi:MAG: M28 family peptidase, partial [candidate division Zixibacteria bacterium]|nr:M28 family peptidase [candidate division Zixibacteria bacterium]